MYDIGLCFRFLFASQDQLIADGRSGSAPQVSEWLANIQFASRETEMNVKNVRLHIRILRRLSLAVEDPAAPVYKNSALYYFERNEGLFGRKAPEMAVQESGKYLDQFQAALPDLADLRNAAETWHILNLRGCAPRLAGRQVVEHARALSMYSRIPAALVPRFARYSGMLGNFLGPREFHVAFPVGLDFDGNPVPPHKKVEYPVFGHESLERLVGELLVPVLAGKRHSSLMNATQPLALTFVKTLLPELEQLYISETTTRSDAPAAASEASMLEDTDATEEAPVTDKEAQALQEQYETAKEALLDVLATEQMSRYIVFLHHDDASLMDKLMGQPMLNDGSVKLWSWSAGLQATKDPPLKVSPYRMKGYASEENLKLCIDVTSRCLGESDTALWFSGKNSFVWAAIKKEVGNLRPRVGARELCLEVDTQQLMSYLRVDANRAGTIDPQEPYLLMMKTRRALLQRKSGPRRFVGGNSAFKCMAGLPLLRKSAMLHVPVDERERCFRGVAPTEKWCPNKSRASAGAAPASGDLDDEEEDHEDDLDTAMPDASGKVVLFWMEMHPKAPCALLAQFTHA